MRRRFLCVLLVSLIAHPAASQDTAAARDRAPIVQLAPGTRVRVTTDAGARWTGGLVSMDDTVLVVRRDAPLFVAPFAIRARVDRRTVRLVEVSATPHRRARATFLGAIAGAVTGAALGAMSVHNPCTDPSTTFGGPCIDRGKGAMLGGFVGLSVGLLVGRHVFGRDRWQDLAPGSS